MRGILKSSKTFIVPGKWILAGEHSVLRGGEAIVFPLMSRFLKLTYQPDADIKRSEALSIQLVGQENQKLETVIRSVIYRAFEKLGLGANEVCGELQFESCIRFGAGMGASATLCVALTRLLCELGYINHTEMYEFARDLENLFHGESSGVDVAVALGQQPMIFSRLEGFKTFSLAQKPFLYLSYTGVQGVTKDCVTKVKSILQEQPEFGKQVDQQMFAAVEKFKSHILSKASTEVNLDLWQQLMTLAYGCFQQWGLVNPIVEKHEQLLKKAGARAVKLTGSGGGGYMLSLWERPPEGLEFEMIPCFGLEESK